MKTRLIILSILLTPFVGLSQIYLGDNGLTVSGSGTSKKVRLGGALLQNTDIDLGSSYTFNLKKGTATYLSVLNNGYLGIGTSSPTLPLDVNGLSVFRNYLTVNAGVANVTMQLRDNGLYFSRTEDGDYANYILGYDNSLTYVANSRQSFYVNGSHTMTIIESTMGGKVGVGNSEPAARFQVKGFGTTSASTAFLIQDQNDGEILKVNDDKSIAFGSNLAYLGSSGNFGIGTITPSAQLHTTGTVRFEGLANDPTAARILASDLNGNISWRDATTIGSSNWTLSGTNVYNSNAGLVLIGQNTAPLFLPEDPNLKLAVSGSMYAKKVKITQSNWADYVFEKDYDLPSLSYVENYIKVNKHLPDVPSALDVEKNGIDLGDNQAILLKKIEELTLYVIQQQKEIEELKMQIKK